jgi:hypothetical protein
MKENPMHNPLNAYRVVLPGLIEDVEHPLNVTQTALEMVGDLLADPMLTPIVVAVRRYPDKQLYAVHAVCSNEDSTQGWRWVHRSCGLITKPQWEHLDAEFKRLFALKGGQAQVSFKALSDTNKTAAAFVRDQVLPREWAEAPLERLASRVQVRMLTRTAARPAWAGEQG